jgi:hypothetical protein
VHAFPAPFVLKHCCSDLELASQLQLAAEAADDDEEQSHTDWSLLLPGTKVKAALQELRVSKMHSCYMLSVF